jgi:hypothetical protein
VQEHVAGAWVTRIPYHKTYKMDDKSFKRPFWQDSYYPSKSYTQEHFQIALADYVATYQQLLRSLFQMHEIQDIHP